jgi:thiol-disulfide isomerase/thioredoxin
MTWLIIENVYSRCGHCKQLEPEFREAAKKLKHKAKLGAVDCTVHQELAQKYGIRGYPTIKGMHRCTKPRVIHARDVSNCNVLDLT